LLFDEKIGRRAQRLEREWKEKKAQTKGREDYELFVI